MFTTPSDSLRPLNGGFQAVFGDVMLDYTSQVVANGRAEALASVTECDPRAIGIRYMADFLQASVLRERALTLDIDLEHHMVEFRKRYNCGEGTAPLTDYMADLQNEMEYTVRRIKEAHTHGTCQASPEAEKAASPDEPGRAA